MCLAISWGLTRVIAGEHSVVQREHRTTIDQDGAAVGGHPVGEDEIAELVGGAGNKFKEA